MKKEILLAVGLVAVYLAAREYGINSVDDVKKAIRPYLKHLEPVLKAVDLNQVVQA